MDSSQSVNKILDLLSHNLSYNLLNLATQQLFNLANNSPAASFWRIVEHYKGLIDTKAESTRKELPRILLPQLVKFYNRHREAINEFVMAK